MTETVLYVAHPEADGSLSQLSLEALTVARSTAASLGAPLLVGLFGGDVHPAASSIGGCGASLFLAVEGPDFVQPPLCQRCGCRRKHRARGKRHHHRGCSRLAHGPRAGRRRAAAPGPHRHPCGRGRCQRR
jgi:hypothetical protein